jgi:tetratricopeptide (TPR) repeat protein
MPLLGPYSMQIRTAFLFCFSIVLVLISCNSEVKNAYSSVEGSFEAATFVGSESCKSCHENEYALWENSHHDQAMKIADSTSILADFNNVTFEHNNVKSFFYKKDGDYYVNTQGEDGTYADYKIIYTFGFTPLQQYIVKLPNGEFNCLLTAWDSVENKWFQLLDDLVIEPDEWINWTGGSQRWNTMCADCHSTNLHKNYDSKTQIYNTTYSEINVSCEACHGPSSAHNSFYENQEKNPDESLVPPKMYMGSYVPPKELVDKCARCHSRRTQLTKYFDYEGEFNDHYYQQLIDAPQYELDGQILGEDYVYGSFIQSKMYSLGISCKDCHDVHSLKLKKDGNNLCSTCHIPATYDTPEHHFHEMNTEGAQCINCHMTGVTYMGNDFRRDHSFRIPRPDQSVKYETPNACNTCHTDKSAEWASDFIVEKYGPNRADHFSDHLLKGYFEDSNAWKVLFSNSNYPAIARATALAQYVNQPLTQQQIQELAAYLKDPEVMVRNEAIRAFELIKPQGVASSIKPLLNDSIRVIRISAARYFNGTGEFLPNDAAFEKANKEYLENLETNSDFSQGLNEIAIYHQMKGNSELAIENYKKAILEDNRNNRPRLNLAFFYYEQGLIEESEALYLKVAEQEPEFSYSYYMLGLLYNELGQQNKSLEYLKLATEKQPVNINAFYNYIVMLQQRGEQKESLKIAKEALNISPNNERILYVQLTGQLNLGDLREAYKTCLQLIQINPTNGNYQQILAQISAGLN